MNHSGDAAEQVIRLTLDGIEVAARITGAAAKQIAIFLMAALKSNDGLKLKGKARLTSMLKSGKALEIFSVKDSDLKQFMNAKQYGIVYCVLRDRKGDADGLCDIMVKADDAPKISRVIERFQFATVDKAKIESELVQAKAEAAIKTETAKAQGAEMQTPDRNDPEKLVDDLLGPAEGKAAPGQQTEAAKQEASKVTPPNPEKAKTEKSLPSEPTSERRSRTAEGTLSKPSVRGELRDIKAARQAKAEAETPAQDKQAERAPKGKNASTTHRQPPAGGKPKPKKPKAR